VQDSHLQQNIQLTRLSDEDFRAVDQLSSERGPVRFLDPSRHLGFDIFDEENDQPVANNAPWD
jgi:alcohol dehydrogenase (NADP+)